MKIEVRVQGRPHLEPLVSKQINQRKGLLKPGENKFKVEYEIEPGKTLGYVVHGTLEKSEEKILFKASRVDSVPQTEDEKSSDTES